MITAYCTKSVRTALLLVLFVSVLPGASLDASVAFAGERSGDELAAHAARIDGILARSWQEAGVRPNPPLSDELFCRRIYLDLIGRIPTHSELISFTSDRDQDRRQKLIDTLLAHRGWVAHNFHFWADLLRLRDNAGRLPSDSYERWLKESLAANVPYDEMVHALLTAEGDVLAPGNGATGYIIRDSGMPLDNMSNTMRVFAGTRMACAQCHDHPFDVWTRRDFFSIAAFTHGTDVQQDRKRVREMRKYVKKNDIQLSDDEERRLRQLVQQLGAEVSTKADGSIKLPDDYQYEDGKPGDRLAAAVPFGEPVAGVDPADHSRESFVQWLIHPDNPRFAAVMANRQWQRFLGVGIVEPLDDWRQETVGSHPELLAALTEIFVAVDFDVRALQGVILRTDAYQRSASRSEWQGGSWHFTGPTLRRMSAEQIWDSLVTLIIPRVDERRDVNRRDHREIYAEVRDAGPAKLVDMVREYEAIRAEQGELHQRMRSLRDSDRADKRQAMKQLREQLGELDRRRRHFDGRGDPDQRREEDAPWRGYSRHMVRASELPSPAPPGHFLAEFGQSDRQQIDNGHTDPAVTQTLFLFNGSVDQHVMHKRGVLRQAIESCETPQEVVGVIYRSLLGRSPTFDETQVLARQVAAAEDTFPADLVWALFNTGEFLFIQ